MPDCVLQHIYNYVPYSSYDYMDGLLELLVIAEETGVTPLGRLQQERAMRRAYQPAPMEVDVAFLISRQRPVWRAYLHARPLTKSPLDVR